MNTTTAARPKQDVYFEKTKEVLSSNGTPKNVVEPLALSIIEELSKLSIGEEMRISKNPYSFAANRSDETTAFVVIKYPYEIGRGSYKRFNTGLHLTYNLEDETITPLDIVVGRALEINDFARVQLLFSLNFHKKLYSLSNAGIAFPPLYLCKYLGSNQRMKIEFALPRYSGDCDKLKWTQQKLLPALIDTFSTLEELHKEGYCHGDISPKNLLCDKDRFRLNDFDFGTDTILSGTPKNPSAFLDRAAVRGLITPATDIVAMLTTTLYLLLPEAYNDLMDDTYHQNWHRLSRYLRNKADQQVLNLAIRIVREEIGLRDRLVTSCLSYFSGLCSQDLESYLPGTTGNRREKWANLFQAVQHNLEAYKQERLGPLYEQYKDLSLDETMKKCCQEAENSQNWEDSRTLFHLVHELYTLKNLCAMSPTMLHPLPEANPKAFAKMFSSNGKKRREGFEEIRGTFLNTAEVKEQLQQIYNTHKEAFWGPKKYLETAMQKLKFSPLLIEAIATKALENQNTRVSKKSKSTPKSFSIEHRENSITVTVKQRALYEDCFRKYFKGLQATFSAELLYSCINEKNIILSYPKDNRAALQLQRSLKFFPVNSFQLRKYTGMGGNPKWEMRQRDRDVDDFKRDLRPPYGQSQTILLKMCEILENLESLHKDFILHGALDIRRLAKNSISITGYPTDDPLAAGPQSCPEWDLAGNLGIRTPATDIMSLIRTTAECLKNYTNVSLVKRFDAYRQKIIQREKRLSERLMLSCLAYFSGVDLKMKRKEELKEALAKRFEEHKLQFFSKEQYALLQGKSQEETMEWIEQAIAKTWDETTPQLDAFLNRQKTLNTLIDRFIAQPKFKEKAAPSSFEKMLSKDPKVQVEGFEELRGDFPNAQELHNQILTLLQSSISGMCILQ